MRFDPRNLLKTALSLALLAAVFAWVDPIGLLARLRHVDAGLLGLAMALNFVLLALNAAKLRLLFPPPRPSLAGALGANLLGAFFATFLPGGGGEVARWASLGRDGVSRGRALAAILMDRITGLWIQVAMALAAWIAIGRGNASLGIAIPAAFLLLAATLGAGLYGYRGAVALARRAADWYARRRGRPAGPAEDLGDALADLLSAPGRLLAVLAVSGLHQALVLGVFLLLDRALGGDLGPGQAILYLFLHTVILLLPVTLGSWGLSEGTLGLLYRYGGSHGETGVLLSLLIRAMALPAALAGGILFLRGGAGLSRGPRGKL